jgi:hypothetical protein
MLVRCLNNHKENGYKHPLEVGKVYPIIEVTFAGSEKHRTFCIQADDDGTPCLFPFSLFEVVDEKVPDDWCLEPLNSSYFGEGSFMLGPKEFADYEGFWDKYHDGEPEAEKIFADVLKKIRAFHGLDAKEKQIKKYIRNILRYEWDPIGVKDIAEAEDEYDGYAEEVYHKLAGDASSSDILKYLLWAEDEHMGLVADHDRANAVTDKILDYYNREK